MAGIEVPVRLRTIEEYILVRHGEPRSLSFDEVERFYRYLSDVVEVIRGAWPVDTGLSSLGWRFRIINRPDEISALIMNDVPYAEWVHRKGAPADPPLWATLVPETLQAFAPAFLAELRSLIDRTETALAMGADWRRVAVEPLMGAA